MFPKNLSGKLDKTGMWEAKSTKYIPWQPPTCKVRSLEAINCERFPLFVVSLERPGQSTKTEWFPKEVSHAKIDFSILHLRIIIDIPWSETDVHPFMLI